MSNPERQISTAVILAAGMGIRLGKRGEAVPKGLLEFGGKALIVRSLEQLFNSGISKVYVVVGHLANEYEQVLSQFNSVTTVLNPFYSTSGSMNSLLHVQHLVGEDFLLLESDIIYELRGLTSLINSGTASALLVSGLTNSGDEVWVQEKSGRLSNLSKMIDVDEVVCGEFVGITKVSSNLFKHMCIFASNSVELLPQMDYEQALLAASEVEDVDVVLIEDYVWGEVDNDDHERRILENVLPKIRASSARVDEH